MIRNARVAASAALMATLLHGCATVENSAGRATIDIDPGSRGPVAGVGIEGHDIVSMADRMMRDIMSVPALAASGAPPQILIDGSDFRNAGPQRLDKDIITDRLRIALNSASRGRMVFVSRQHTQSVAQERELKRVGMVDGGTLAPREAMAGVDYKLVGNITAITSSLGAGNGLTQRMNQIAFEMIDLERGTIVWGATYTIARAAADDIVYR